MSEIRSARSYCRTCLAACGVRVELSDNRVLRVTGDREHPLSQGYTCPKGRAMGALQHHPDRLDVPTIRSGGQEALHKAVEWPSLLEDLGGRLAVLREAHDPGAIGIYIGTGGGYDSLGMLVARGLSAALPLPSTYSAMTIDTPCLPLVSSLMSGSMMPNPVLDLVDARLTLLLGTNPMASHGHTTAWPNPTEMLRHLSSEGRELWVADPRRTKTAHAANRYLPIRPSSDHALLAFLLRELLGPDGGANLAHIEARTMDLDRLERAVQPWDLARAARETGLPTSDLEDLLSTIRREGRIAVLTGTGCSMQRQANVVEWLSWALQIVTDSFERPGGQWFHPGASNRFEQFPDFDTPVFQDTPASPLRPEVPRHVGEMPCSVLVDEIEAGRLKGLVVLGGDPLTSFPNAARTRAALESLDLLAVVDIVAGPMTQIATHVLPATAPLERYDIPGYMESAQTTVVSQVAVPLVEPAAGRRPLWWTMAKLGEALGVRILPGGLSADETNEEDLLQSLLANGRNEYAAIAGKSAIVRDDVRREVRGWVEKKLPGGRWRLAPVELVGQLEAFAANNPPAETHAEIVRPLRMVSGRQLRKMNSALRGIHAKGERVDEAAIFIHPRDAAKAGITDGTMIRVQSASGKLVGRARPDASIREGVIWVPHGWPELNVGQLTSDRHDVDSLTGMVLQTGLPVSVEVDA
jgi:anaerobic selenocysteine-containing dehydrogenase